MPRAELAHLELLAEVDSLVERLKRWADKAPGWHAGRPLPVAGPAADRNGRPCCGCGSRPRWSWRSSAGPGRARAPVCALVGAEAVRTGRSRPTTILPTLVCRRGLGPEKLGIDPASVECVHVDLPALRDLVLIDCPDPDTTEEEGERRGRGERARARNPLVPDLPSPLSSNLARLRAILPHCDVLLVTATQQKYRSARVAGELAAAARGGAPGLRADPRRPGSRHPRRLAPRAWRREPRQWSVVSGQWSVAGGQRGERGEGRRVEAKARRVRSSGDE